MGCDAQLGRGNDTSALEKKGVGIPQTSKRTRTVSQKNNAAKKKKKRTN